MAQQDSLGTVKNSAQPLGVVRAAQRLLPADQAASFGSRADRLREEALA